MLLKKLCLAHSYFCYNAKRFLLLILTLICTTIKTWEYGKIHVFGDSQAPFCFTNFPHAMPSNNIPQVGTEAYKIYEKSFFSYKLGNKDIIIPFEIHWIIGRTMHRIGRDKLIGFNIKEYNVINKDIVVFCFGCIDVGSHIFVQVSLGRNCDEIVDTLVKNYINIILENKNQFEQLTVVILAILPPYIMQATELYYLKFFPQTSFLESQVNVTNKLNYSLESYCKKNGFLYLNVNNLFQSENGKLSEEFSDGSHHVHPKYNFLIKEKLINLLKISN